MIRSKYWLRFGAFGKNNAYFCRVASILMPLKEDESDCGIKIDATKEKFPVILIFFAFS